MPKKTTKKPVVAKKPVIQKKSSMPRTESARRVLKNPKAIWYKPLTWRHRPAVPAYKPLPKARILFWNTLQLLWGNWKPFVGIAVVFAVLDVLLVRGTVGSGNFSDIKSSLDSLSSGVGGRVGSSVVSFAYLVVTSGSSSSDNTNAGIYQTILYVICSLAIIWALRQVVAKHVVGMRDSFYQGMYPLIPFILLLLLLAVQLLPLTIGGGLYALAVGGSIAIHWWEKAIFLALFIGLALWSLRMLTASIFAAYIVTLPNMTPLRAYRSARQLVYGRRLLLWRKLIFLPVVLLLLAAVIELPLIFFVPTLAAWLFFILGVVVLPIVHGYLYNLYREMI